MKFSFFFDVSDLQKMSDNRIGRRIRKIREEADPPMSQGDLGNALGLNADRIQQYENGSRTPRPDLLKKIADALGVEVMALADPDTTSVGGAMHAFFEMEHYFNLHPVEDHKGDIILEIDTADKALENCLNAWYWAWKGLQDDLENAATKAEKEAAIRRYHMWEWTFPLSVADPFSNPRDNIEFEIERLQKRLDELQEKLKNLPE